MARKGRVDRGLTQRADKTGKLWWHVRLYHDGHEREFGSFPTKTKAREFYEKAKLEQKEGRFFPERYQRGGTQTMEKIIETYTATLASSGKKRETIEGERQYARWWTDRLRDHRLGPGTSAEVERAKQDLLAQGLSPQTITHYLKFLRHALYSVVGRDTLRNNPFTTVKMPKVRLNRLRFLSLKEETKLCEAIGARYVSWVRLAILTGLRKSEQFGLRWTDVGSGDRDHYPPLPQSRAGAVCATHG